MNGYVLEADSVTVMRDPVYSCRLNSACVRSRTKVILKFFGGSIIFVGLEPRFADLDG